MRIRTTALSLMLVAAVLTGCSGDPPTAPGRAAGKAAPAPPSPARFRIPSGGDLPGWSHSVGFSADGSGFALLAQCTREPAEPDQSSCRQHLAALDAGADAWTLRTSPLPDIRGGDGVTAALTVLGPGRALVAEGAGDPDRTWFTRDGGRSWMPGTTKPSGVVGAIGPSAALRAQCVEEADENSCAKSRIVAVMPDTGQLRALAAQPPLRGPMEPAGDLPDGSRWVSGLDPETGAPALAVTRDGARSWTTASLPGAPRSGWSLRVASGKGVVYAAQPGGLPAAERVKNGLLAVYRSTDDGATWAKVWTFRKGREPRSILGGLIAAQDGSVTVHGEHGVHRSTDGGRTFRPAGDGGLAGSVGWTPLGYLWSDSYGHGRYRLSADGVRWQAFTLGSGSH
ncbi:exo-alpha-sialidase [Streptomyces sp. NPDC051907]|uniref:WD40/YVTN/BNR-like repeat-containing protein n=1 Tax=Streptomyces sp. NPDC051907 TaxID=3155284 RepID=UPI003437C725